jgi:hypothetical protein
VKVSGLARTPLLSGNVAIADGSVYLSQTGVTVKNIKGGYREAERSPVRTNFR